MGEIRNAERTRRAILEAAREEFFERGFNGVRIESIAKRAKVNKQLIYHYFKNKEELMSETIEDFTDSISPEKVTLPANPAHIAEFRYKVNQEHLLDFLRFTAWEAVEKLPEDRCGRRPGREFCMPTTKICGPSSRWDSCPRSLIPPWLPC